MKVKVTLVRSAIGSSTNQKDCIRGLGLRKTNTSSIVEDTPATRGMMNKISHLIKVDKAE